MGGQISYETKISENELIRGWVGLEPMSENDPFWNQLLSFNFTPPRTRRERRLLDESAKDALEALMYNTGTTGNLAAFVRVSLRRLSELRSALEAEDKIFLWQAANALLLLRSTAVFLAERLAEAELLRVFERRRLSEEGEVSAEREDSLEQGFASPAEELLNALVEILVDLEVREETRSLHREATLTLIALLSSQLAEERPNPSSHILRLLNSGRAVIHAPLLAKTLLRNLLEHSGEEDGGGSLEAGGSVVLGIASSLWSAISKTLADDEEDGGGGSEEEAKVSTSSLGALSLQLLLLLTSHSAAEAGANPYRAALASFHNSQEVTPLPGHSGEGGGGLSLGGSFKTDYSSLYSFLCGSVEGEEEMLLLYLLLHRNSGFRNFVLSRVNLEDLVLPVLKVLYLGSVSSARASSHHVYLALIAILILSEDEFFAKVVHETVVGKAEWYRERHLSSCSLGSLIILVLTRTIQHNILKVRDRYLHTNCLAALANLSAFFKDLPAVVAQRLLGLLELLTKRHGRLVDHLRVAGSLGVSGMDGEGGDPEVHQSSGVKGHQEDIMALEEGIRTMLEILNSSLTHTLRHNPHLIYTMLYQRALFDSFQNHPMFQDLIWNISAVLNHFAGRVGSLEKGASVAEVLELIRKGALQWPSDRLKKFPDLKFKYVEDDATEDFFVPYVWQLVFKHSPLFADPAHIRLFSTHALR